MRAPCGMPIIARPPGLPATSPHRQSRALARTARPDQSRSTRPPALCSTEPRQISLALPLVPLALDVATLTANSRAHRPPAQPLAPRPRPPDYPLRLGAVVPPSICRAAGALPTPGHSPLSRPALTLISHPRAPCIAPDQDRSEREIHSRGLGHTLTMVEAIQRVVARRTGWKPRATAFPWWLLTLASPFVATFREIREMRYLWREPVRMDNARLVAALGQEPHTRLDEAVEATLVGLGCLAASASSEARALA